MKKNTRKQFLRNQYAKAFQDNKREQKHNQQSKQKPYIEIGSSIYLYITLLQTSALDMASIDVLRKNGNKDTKSKWNTREGKALNLFLFIFNIYDSVQLLNTVH